MVALWSQLVVVLIKVAVVFLRIVCVKRMPNVISSTNGWMMLCVEKLQSGVCFSPDGIEGWTTTVSKKRTKAWSVHVGKRVLQDVVQ